MKTVVKTLVTRVETTSKVATYVAGAYFNAVYHVRTNPVSNKLVSRVQLHWTAESPVNIFRFPCIATSESKSTEPTVILAPATVRLDRSRRAILAIIFSTAQRMVATSIISSPMLNLKP